MLFAINSADLIPIERDCLENYFSRILEQFDSFHSINIILVKKKHTEDNGTSKGGRTR